MAHSDLATSLCAFVVNICHSAMRLYNETQLQNHIAKGLTQNDVWSAFWLHPDLDSPVYQTLDELSTAELPGLLEMPGMVSLPLL